MKKQLYFTAFVHLLINYSFATNYYLRVGATGSNNGSSWTNAWNQANQINYGSISAGDTIFIAAGTYGTFDILKGGTVTNPITIKRATSLLHGSNNGWSAAYDGQVIIDGGGGLAAVSVGTSNQVNNLIIDGSTRYGIWIRNAMYGVKPRGGANSVSNNLTLKYLEIGDAGTYKLGEDAIQGSGNDLIVEYCYLHDNDNNITHGDNVQWFVGNNLIFRYNVMKNGGQMFMFGVEAWGDYVNDVSMYYNIFYNRGGDHYNGITFDKDSPQPGHFVHLYNNTFDLEAANNGYNNIFNLTNALGPVEFKNNAIIYSVIPSIAGSTHSYNGYDNAGTFKNHLNGYADPSIGEIGSVVAADLGFVSVTTVSNSPANYRLTASSILINKGANVGLTKDFDGNPISGNPDIGAFEYVFTTAINESSNDQLTITPNPVNSALVIHADVLKNDNIKCTVYDLYGKEMLVQPLNSNREIDVSELQEGIYFIQIQIENNSTFKKFIVKH